jgi:steroid delta-isomerase-like uncharacterized protein
MEVETTATGVEQLAMAYGDAWNGHDLDAIMAMHAPDSVFQLNLGGAPEVVGVEAIQEAFAAIFAAWPDIHFATDRLYAHGPLFVNEYTITATLAEPFSLGGLVAEPTGRPVAFRGVDVIPVADGLVRRKDTYLDLVAVQQQLGLLEQ